MREAKNCIETKHKKTNRWIKHEKWKDKNRKKISIYKPQTRTLLSPLHITSTSKILGVTNLSGVHYDEYHITSFPHLDNAFKTQSSTFGISHTKCKKNSHQNSLIILNCEI